MEMEIRSPQDIKEDVSSQLFWDDSLDSSGITVDVSDGHVILTGMVPSYSDRMEAENDAYMIPGVNNVENQLRVNPGVTRYPGDEEIMGRVRYVLNWSSAVDASGIDVSVDRGVVTLSGSVDSYWQKKRAQELASNVYGVVDEINDLVVNPHETAEDGDIEKDILSALGRSYFDTSNIHVSVDGCVVTLNGTVDSHVTYRAVQQIADHTNSVCDVVNNLIVT